MADPNPTISLYLDGELSFQLGRKGFSGTTPNLKVQMHDTSHAATLVIPGYRPVTKTFSLPLALQEGLFELLDKETDTKVSVPPNDEDAGELVVNAGARNQWFDLKIDARDDFWTQLLIPGHKYEIRWQADGNVPWAYRGEAHSGPSQRLAVRCLPRPIKLTVFDDATAPPQISVSLAPTAEICHLSGEPPFGFKLQIISHEEEVITLCLHKTPLKELHGLEEIAYVVDEEGEEVEWPWGIGCFEGKEPFPSDNMFEELKSDIPYERTLWLKKYDKETSNGGELEHLDAGSSYKVEVSKTLLELFSKWRKGKKEELLAGTEKEKEERWSGKSGQIIVEISDPFTFKTV